ncbi:hypothetical protein F1643_16240 [Azospirillum sp. INR13]|nr:hypothetical protein [Azospirillum sp. INR13]
MQVLVVFIVRHSREGGNQDFASASTGNFGSPPSRIGANLQGSAHFPMGRHFFRRHPREGGDPGLPIGSALEALDPRLRGDDGR